MASSKAQDVPQQFPWSSLLSALFTFFLGTVVVAIVQWIRGSFKYRAFKTMMDKQYLSPLKEELLNSKTLSIYNVHINHYVTNRISRLEDLTKELAYLSDIRKINYIRLAFYYLAFYKKIFSDDNVINRQYTFHDVTSMGTNDTKREDDQKLELKIEQSKTLITKFENNRYQFSNLKTDDYKFLDPKVK